MGESMTGGRDESVSMRLKMQFGRKNKRAPKNTSKYVDSVSRSQLADNFGNGAAQSA